MNAIKAQGGYCVIQDPVDALVDYNRDMHWRIRRQMPFYPDQAS